MTAPLLTLPISAPAASGGGQATPGAAAATGFEALLAALFAVGDGEAGAGLPVEGEKVETTGETDAPATDAAPTTPVDAQTLAALLAVTPQQTQVQAPTTTEGGETEQAPAGAPPAAFSPLLAQEIATAPAAAPATDTAAEATEVEAAPVETALVEIPDTPVAGAQTQATAKADTAEKPLPPGLEKPREGQVTPAAEHAQAKGAPPAHAASVQAPPPPAEPETAANPLVQAEAVATEVEVPAEPVKEQAPAKASKTETGRRQAGAKAPAQAAAPAAAAPEAAPAPAAAEAADASGEPALAIEDEPAAAVTSGEAKPQTADAPDAQGPATTAAAAHNAAGPATEAPLPVRGSPETVAHLSAQIVKKLEGRSTHFDVELNPAGLGHVTVSVEIGAQGKMTAALQFESAQAANELRGRAPELQKALEQAGFDLSGGGLSFDVAGDRGQQGRGDLYQQQQQQNDGGAWRGRAFQAVLDTNDGAADAAAAAAALQLQRRPATGVDVRV